MSSEEAWKNGQEDTNNGSASRVVASDNISCFDVMETDTDTTDAVTVLGNQLQGSPFSVAVMQQASINLYGSANGISENKWYVRMRPTSPEQLFTLDNLDIELYDYPLDYEILHEGDYYPQPGIGSDEIPWFYAMVEPGFQPPAGVLFELLQQVYIPDTDLYLEKEAFRITGNVYEDSCDVTVNRLPVPCEIDPCAPGCPIGGCDPGGGGGSTPNPKKPAGNIKVWDNRLNNGQSVAVRRIRVVARNFLKAERVYTDDNGHFSFSKNFNKATLIVKMKNNNTAVRELSYTLRNLVYPMKKNIGKYKGNLSNIQYTFFRQESFISRGMNDWVGVTVFNKRMDFNGLAAQDGLTGVPSFLNIFITPHNGTASTPMFPHRFPDNNELISFFITQYMFNVSWFPPIYAELVNDFARTRVDMVFGYERSLVNLDSDDISETMFHELAHAQHYNKVGNDYWHNFVLSELTETALNQGTQFDPYGTGNTANSPIIALAESWAYHYGRVLADRVYGVNFSSPQREQEIWYTNNTPVNGLSSHLNLLEDFSPNRDADPFRWIPQGIYHDMSDDRNDVLQIPQRVDINDEVIGYTNQQFFNALDQDIISMQSFRDRLLSENSNSQSTQVNNLFIDYHY